jgi:hypothetical protein
LLDKLFVETIHFWYSLLLGQFVVGQPICRTISLSENSVQDNLVLEQPIF